VYIRFKDEEQSLRAQAWLFAKGFSINGDNSFSTKIGVEGVRVHINTGCITILNNFESRNDKDAKVWEFLG